jgi:hypothetical protein
MYGALKYVVLLWNPYLQFVIALSSHLVVCKHLQLKTCRRITYETIVVLFSIVPTRLILYVRHVVSYHQCGFLPRI